ncbi:MAG: hypothetical protein E7643_05600 [Ruminococcaceae bacterium]|nr:hypothetical protein [Oscillospiraceae bacterium]
MSEQCAEREHNIEEGLRANGFYVSTTVGMSMKPMLRNRRDRVVLVPVGEERLRRWDLPMYRREDGKYVLHRIIAVKKDHYVIRGDNTFKKEYVKDAQLIGVVSEFYRGDRHVQTDARGYRVYAALWHFIFPVRLLLFKMRRLASKIKHAIVK